MLEGNGNGGRGLHPFQSLIPQHGFLPTILLLQAQVTPLCLLGLTLGEGDKCPIPLGRRPAASLSALDAVEAALALLHCSAGV